MRKLFLLVFLYVLPVNANIVPNFVQGSMQSTTNTQSTITESITSTDYFGNSYEYTVTGTNIKADGATLLPPSTSVSNTMDGVTTTWSSLDANSVPNFSIKNPDQSWQFTTTLSQPGMVNQTLINRTTDMTSVTDTVSTFSQ